MSAPSDQWYKHLKGRLAGEGCSIEGFPSELPVQDSSKIKSTLAIYRLSNIQNLLNLCDPLWYCDDIVQECKTVHQELVLCPFMTGWSGTYERCTKALTQIKASPKGFNPVLGRSIVRSGMYSFSFTEESALCMQQAFELLGSSRKDGWKREAVNLRNAINAINTIKKFSGGTHA